MTRAQSAKPIRQRSFSGHVRCALAVLTKDIACEARTRHALVSVLLFAVTSTIAVSFVLNVYGDESAVSSALLWIVIYFSAMSGLSRSFTREEDTRTADMLRLCASPNSVYLGKLGFNLVSMIAVEIVAVPLFVVLMDCPIARPGLFTALLFMGTLALSAGATTSAAMVARASARGALYASISFPLLIPALLMAIHGTGVAISGGAPAIAASDLRVLVYYSVIVITASLMLFRFVWED